MSAASVELAATEADNPVSFFRRLFRPAWVRNLLLFAAITLAFVAWRAPARLVWDDSPSVCHNLYTTTGQPRVSFAMPRFWHKLWKYEIGALHPDGYRPLSWALRRFGLACQLEFPWAATAFLWVNGIVCGLLGVAYYRLAKRFTRRALGAALATFLLLASTPVLTGFLVLFTGMQALVPLAMCCALHCYFRSRESRRPAVWIGLMCVLLIVAPLYREFAGLMPLVIIFLELQRGRWRSGVVVLCFVAFVHALYPTALPHLLFFPHLQVAPVFKLGVLGFELERGTTAASSFWQKLREASANLHWRIFFDIMSVLPPSLLLLAFAGWVLRALRQRDTAIPWRHALFLGFFFLLTFLPFLKVFKEQVHLTYCLVPACILVAASVEALWLEASAYGKWAALGVASVVLMTVADQALNPYVVRRATRRLYAVMDRVSEYCRRHIPPGSILLCNAHHGAELRNACHGQFAVYFTVMTSGRTDRLIDNPQQLADLARCSQGKRLFCLDVRLPNLDHQIGRDRVNWIVNRLPSQLRSYGGIGSLSYRYAFVDPLRMALPRGVVPWPSSPDLEFDYYHGRALDGAHWLREVAVAYDFYGLKKQESPFTSTVDRRSERARKDPHQLAGR